MIQQLPIPLLVSSDITSKKDEFIDNDNIKLLSLSVTPEIDNVKVLKEYAVQKGVNDSKWNITTGSKKHIYELARKLSLIHI